MTVLIRNYLNKETLVADIVHILLFDDCTKSVTTLRLTRPSVDRDKYRSRLKKLTWQLGVMSSDGHWDIFLRTLHKLVHVIANPCLLLFDQITIFEIKN